jgi:hypothetical protein
MSDKAAVPETPQQPAAPPFDPDPELSDHLEGNHRERDAYQNEAKELRREAQESTTSHG